MGGFMAKNLLKAGHPLTVFDKSDKAVDGIKSAGSDYQLEVRKAESPADIATDCSMIITMLPSSPHVLDVYTNDKTGILAGLKSGLNSNKAGSFFIDSSTIDPGSARQVAALAEKVGCHMIDAPVSGGVTGAEAGTLTFMVGASDADFKVAQPILAKMGKNIVHCGATGTGQIAKVCNNLVLGISMAAVSEAMAIGVRLGADPVKLASIFNTSSARCWSSDAYNPVPGVMQKVPSSRDYEGGFGTLLMMKDLGLAIQAAEQAGMKAELGQFSLDMYKQLEGLGLAQKDFGVIYKMLVEQLHKKQ